MSKTDAGMDSGDYTLVCYKQLLLATGNPQRIPKDWLDIFREGFDYQLYSDALSMADELFGNRDYDEAGERLFSVEKLTPEESVIAARIDLTHSDKMDLIRPLRAEREAKSDASWERKRSKWQARDEQGIITVAVESMVISEDDRFWASQIGISLD